MDIDHHFEVQLRKEKVLGKTHSANKATDKAADKYRPVQKTLKEHEQPYWNGN